jgi:hypothetical protein
MDPSLVLMQEKAEEFQIVSNTYRKHIPTNALQIFTLFNCYGPQGGSSTSTQKSSSFQNYV